MDLIKPYYEHKGITIYHGDCREILPQFGTADSVITDPVWPNASARLEGSDRPYKIFAEVADLFLANRVIVQLGCDSDPRFLGGMPERFPFFRVCWLEYACPTRKGRVLYSGDVAYVFGVPLASRPGRRVLPGRTISTRPDALRVRVTKHREWGKVPGPGLHPTPRRYEHVKWLISRFADGLIVDPFCGSGTTLVAAKDCGYQAIGIEVVEQYCEIAVKRLTQEVFEF